MSAEVVHLGEQNSLEPGAADRFAAALTTRATLSEPKVLAMNAMPCAAHTVAFDHVADLDYERLNAPHESLATPPNQALIDEASAACGSCAMKAVCLENANQAPDLPIGLFAGLRVVDRLPAWIQHDPDRRAKWHARLQSGQPPAEDLSADEEANPDKLLHNFNAEFAPRPKPSDVLDERRRWVIEVLHNNPILAERLPLLLNNFQQQILSSWYGTGILRWREVPGQREWRNARKAEQRIYQLACEVPSDGFDYAEWSNHYVGDNVERCPRSPLAFLARIRAPIDPRASLAELRKDALSIIDRISICLEDLRIPGSQRRFLNQSLLSDAYGLKGWRVSVQKLATSRAQTVEQIRGVIERNFETIRYVSRILPYESNVTQVAPLPPFYKVPGRGIIGLCRRSDSKIIMPREVEDARALCAACLAQPDCFNIALKSKRKIDEFRAGLTPEEWAKIQRDMNELF